MKRHDQKGFSHIVLVLLVLFLIIITGVVVFKQSSKSSNNSSSNIHTNTSGPAKYDDKFITTVPVDLSQVASISKFRSCSGHDYSSENVYGQPEANRSMKHYINPLDKLVGSVNVIKVFAPFDGTVAATPADSANHVQVGLQVWLTPASNPTWTYIYYHITPVVKAGDSIKAGQIVGYANLSHSSVMSFDIALEAWPRDKKMPLGPGNLSSLSQVLKIDSNYLQLLNAGQLDSAFNHMIPTVLAQFSAKGITMQNIIVSKATRDRSPCPEPTKGVYYQSTANDFVTVQ